MTVDHAAAQLARLAPHLRGRMTMPGDPDWDMARQPWNIRVDQRPAAVIEAEGPDDMAATVSFAARYGLRVTVQSTGHGAGASLDGTILIRTSRLREITIYPDRQLARVGAGVRCDDLMTAVSPHGLATSVGSARDAGIVGLAMFGGVGVLGRTLGFVADHVAAADVVTADGSRLRCDAENHPDLWWALRGGGGGFALVSRLDLRLARLPAVFGGQIVWPGEAAPEVLGAWRSWTAVQPPEMTSSAIVAALPPLPEVPEILRGRRVTIVVACYAGPPDEGEGLLRPLAETAAPLFSSCRPLTPADLASLYGAPTTPLPSRIRAELLADLPDAALGALLRLAGPGTDAPLVVAEIRHLGGAYAQPRDDSGAIGRTTARYLLEMVGLGPTPVADAAVRDFQRAVSAALAPWLTGTIFPGFADHESDAEASRVFPPETRLRLARVKQRYDPGNVLRASFPTT